MSNETIGATFIWGILLISLWELTWKAIALWKAARAGSKAWYVVLLLLNTAGILPILYIFIFHKDKPVKKS